MYFSSLLYEIVLTEPAKALKMLRCLINALLEGFPNHNDLKGGILLMIMMRVIICFREILKSVLSIISRSSRP